MKMYNFFSTKTILLLDVLQILQEAFRVILFHFYNCSNYGILAKTLFTMVKFNKFDSMFISTVNKNG